MKKFLLASFALLMVFGFVQVVDAYDFPSTNDANRDANLPHVNFVSNGVGEVTLEFVNDTNSLSFFEYRIDGEVLTPDGTHPVVTEDDIYPGVCVDGRVSPVCGDGDPEVVTFDADIKVEVRLALGGERDWDFDWVTFEALYPRSAEITSPTSGEDVSGLVNFEAYLNDDDIDSIQWAVREGVCSAGVGTVFGNVDGHSDVATIDTSILSMQTFSFVGDMSAMTPGAYCFIYNPTEDGGESDIRLTSEFNLVAPLVGPPTDKNECKSGGWKTFDNPEFKNQGECVSYVQSNEKAGKRN